MAKYYESEHTAFMRELLQKKPEIAQKQQAGRATWWDKKLDPDFFEGVRKSRVPPSPYAYQKIK